MRIDGGAAAFAHTSDSIDHAVELPSSFHRAHVMQIVDDAEESQRRHMWCSRLVVYDQDMREITSRVYECNYGMDVDAIDLDMDGVPEFVVSLHLGPAIGPAIRELKVLRLRDAFLEEIVSVPLAGQAGPNQGWWYDIEYERVGARGVRVRMTLHHDQLDEWSSYLPQTHCYRISVTGHNLDLQAEMPASDERTEQGSAANAG